MAAHLPQLAQGVSRGTCLVARHEGCELTIVVASFGENQTSHMDQRLAEQSEVTDTS